MDHIVMREPKAVLIIGMLCTGFCTALGLFFTVTENGAALIVFLPFILLGLLIILVYFRHTIILETDHMTISETFRKKRCVYYLEIGTVLIHTANQEMEVILLSHKKERLMKFSLNMTNADKAVDILEDRELPCIDLSEAAESGQNIKEYFSVLTKWEQFFYRPQLQITENVKNTKASKKAGQLEKERRFVKIMGWIMIVLDLAAIIVLEGKPSFVCFVFVLFLAWGMYVWMYPNLFLDVPKKLKKRKYIIEMPFLGISAAALFCLFMTFEVFNYNAFSLMVFVGASMLILLIPFVLKLCLLRQKPDKFRLFLTVLAVLFLANITALPINYITTFQSDGHETVIVKDKAASSGSKTTSYYIYADWREEEHRFSVSKSEYNEFQKGDPIRVCLRHSIFGFHYWTVHK